MNALGILNSSQVHQDCFRVTPPPDVGDTLQLFRLMQALSETSWHLHVPGQTVDRWEIAQTHHLNPAVGVASGSEMNLTNIGVDHAAPRTFVGSLTSPLIFPESMISKLRSLWSDSRPIGVSFTGLITKQRKRTIGSWVKKNSPRKGIRSRTSKWGIVSIQHSLRGRTWPQKAYDPEYFVEMATSKYVICPGGL